MVTKGGQTSTLDRWVATNGCHNSLRGLNCTRHESSWIAERKSGQSASPGFQICNPCWLESMVTLPAMTVAWHHFQGYWIWRVSIVGWKIKALLLSFPGFNERRWMGKLGKKFFKQLAPQGAWVIQWRRSGYALEMKTFEELVTWLTL